MPQLAGLHVQISDSFYHGSFFFFFADPRRNKDFQLAEIPYFGKSQQKEKKTLEKDW